MNSDGKKNIFANSKLFQKIKGIKHLEIVAILVLGAIALLIYFSTFSSIETSNVATSTITSSSGKTDMSQYAKELEEKLAGILSQIKDAGNVDVMITFDGNPTYVYATDDTQKVNSVSNGTTQTSTTQTSSSPILVEINGEEQALVCNEILPDIKGVIIVSSGANNVNVKLELLKAVQTILNVPTSNIEILVGK